MCTLLVNRVCSDVCLQGLCAALGNNAHVLQGLTAHDHKVLPVSIIRSLEHPILAKPSLSGGWSALSQA